MAPKVAIAVVVLITALTVSVVSAAENGGKVKHLRDGSHHPPHSPPIDYSGRKQSGEASYYSKKLSHKKTASGESMDPEKLTAASKTLPLGTRAKVTNTQNGQSVEVTVNDRGPFVKNRILDVTPKAADQLGIKSDGVSHVEIKPLAVPQEDGQVKHSNN